MESAENDPQASSAATEASGAIERSPTNFQARLRRMVTTVLILVVTVGLVVISITGQLQEWMAWSLGHIYAMGALGVVLLIFLYFAATIAMIPAAILNLGAGFLYGAFEGYVVTIVGGMLGATGAYYLSKSWLKEKMQKQLAGNETFDKIVRAMGNGGVGTRHTFIVVMLGRLPPFFPFPLFNYAYAITDVSFPIYFWATFIGVSPATLLDSYIGSLFSSLAALYGEDECPDTLGRNETESFVQLLPEDDGDDGLLQANRTLVTYPTAVACVAKETGMSSEQTWEMVIGVVITLVVTAFLGWYAKRLLDRMADGGDGVNARLHDGLDSSISDNSKRPAVAPDGSPARRSLTPAAEPAEAPASPSHQMLRQSIAEMGDAALTELRAVVDDVKGTDRVNAVKSAGKHMALALPGARIVTAAAESIAGVQSDFADWRGYAADNTLGDGAAAPAMAPPRGSIGSDAGAGDAEAGALEMREVAVSALAAPPIANTAPSVATDDGTGEENPVQPTASAVRP